jgi:hypothetical protein
MTRWVLALALVAAVAAAAAITQQAQNTLTAIDSEPTPTQLDCAFNGSGSSGCPSALPSLQAIAVDDAADAGIRLRAIHALVHYCQAPCLDSDPAHTALTGLLASNGSARAGADLLILRASVDSLGPMQVQNDVQQLTSFLSHPSRDIRATAARALGALCNNTAVPALRDRYQEESTDQVRIAISDALGVLATCIPPP